MDKPDFSIIIVCYNPDFDKLLKTIISCIKQEKTKYEIIISDDGSKEKYLEKLQNWAKDNNINLKYNFIHDNVGTVKNIISGVKMASGKYIKTISPGDYFATPDALETFLHKFEDEECDLVFSDGIFYFGDTIFCDQKMPFFEKTTGKNMKKNISMLADSFLGASLTFRKELVSYLYELDGYVKLTEDLPLTYLALINGKKVGYIDKKLFWYEYGTGVSHIKHYLDADLQGFVNYLTLNYTNNKMVKRTLSVWNVIKIQNSFLRAITLLITHPVIFVMKLARKKGKKQEIHLTIDDLNAITRL